DEEDLARLDGGQGACQVELLLQDRPGGVVDLHLQLARDDRRERGLPQARRAVKKHMVERFAALPRRLDGDRKYFLEFALADEVVQAGGAQRQIVLPIFVERAWRDDAFFRHA